ncbi:hypothetical protein J437_LFUL009795 [Ladona fulva]|uniref:Plastocyanin-like domain-containing protein n=1 Tax=Ladona fulva TaxID=123851 RepID=A0A8K0P249_LADFU|nr:hypothetical protein J437_LFUL009795 [Ladona fulva]
MDVGPDSEEAEKEEKPSESPMATFNVRPGLRHRFRMANAGGVAGCPVRVSIDNHQLMVIALDGNPIQAAQVKSFVLSPGERADFVVTADRPIGDYWMRASADKAEGKEIHPNCRSLKQKAIIHYKSSDYKPKLNFAFPEKLSSYPAPHNHPSEPESLKEGDAAAKVLLNSVDDVCIEAHDSLCVTEVRSLHKLDPDLAVPKVDRTIYLPFDFQLVATDNVSYPPFLVPGTKDVRVPRIANLTFMYPPSPLVTQASDVPYDLRCSQDLFPKRCPTTVGKRMEEGSAIEKGDSDVCECVHQIDIGLGETVELMLVDEGGASDWGHVFHLHGYSFHVVALGSFDSEVESSNRIEVLKDMDRKGKLPRNLVDPVVKDTVFIPSGGYAVLRFKADNPGYWLLHDQHISHSAWGLNVILHVGSDNQLPPTPPDFPKCGSWVGPEFFLI